MRVNHQHLRAFHAVAGEGSISRAARRLNVSQPTLSQQLKALEERHQTALFDGRKPPLRLTSVGQKLFDLTHKLFDTSKDIDALLDESASTESGMVRLGSDSPVYAVRLTDALRQRRAGLKVRVRVGSARETFSWLSEAEIDVGIVSDPPVNSAFFYEPLYSDRLMAALARSHPLADLPVFPMAAMAQERLLVRDGSSRTRAVTEELMLAAGVQPLEVLELHTRETIREGVAIGLGVSLFNSMECPPDARIVYRPVDANPGQPHATGYVVCLADRRRLPTMRAVLDAAGALRAISPLPVYAAKPAALAETLALA